MSQARREEINPSALLVGFGNGCTACAFNFVDRRLWIFTSHDEQAGGHHARSAHTLATMYDNSFTRFQFAIDVV